MKIYEVITEPGVNRMQNNLSDLTRYLRHYCQPYLIKIGGLENALFNEPLLRGMRDGDLLNLHISKSDPFNTINIRKDRLPMDTPKNVNTLIDDWFEERTNVRFRTQSLFCSGSASMVSGYGTIVRIIPMGDFDYCWSRKFRDMYEALENYADTMQGDYDEHELTSLNAKDKINALFSDPGPINDFMEDANYQFDKDLLAGVQSGHEIMLAANKVVIVDSEWLLEAKYHRDNEGWIQ